MKTVNLSQYRSPKGESSMFKGIPIELWPHVKAHFRAMGFPYKIQFRGPRMTHPNIKKITAGRKYSWSLNHAMQSNCPKETATSFAVYQRKLSWWEQEQRSKK